MKKLLALILCLILCLSLFACNASEEPTDTQLTDSENSMKESAIKTAEIVNVTLSPFPTVTLSAQNDLDVKYIDLVTEYFSSAAWDIIGDGTPNGGVIDVAISIQYSDGTALRYIYPASEDILYKTTDNLSFTAYQLTEGAKGPQEFLTDILTEKSVRDKENAESSSVHIAVPLRDGKITFPAASVIVFKVETYRSISPNDKSGFSYTSNLIRYEMNEDIERIKTFFEGLELTVPNDNPGEVSGHENENIYFYFSDGTYLKMHTMRGLRTVYININGQYYEIGQDQYEEFLNVISF